MRGIGLVLRGVTQAVHLVEGLENGVLEWPDGEGLCCDDLRPHVGIPQALHALLQGQPVELEIGSLVQERHGCSFPAHEHPVGSTADLGEEGQPLVLRLIEQTQHVTPQLRCGVALQ